MGVRLPNLVALTYRANQLDPRVPLFDYVLPSSLEHIECAVFGPEQTVIDPGSVTCTQAAVRERRISGDF